MRIKFWGVRGSVPSPTTGEDVAARLVEALYRLGQDPARLDLSNRDAIRSWVEALPQGIRSIMGGNTPCVEVRIGDELFIIDLGSGLRSLGNELMRREFGEGKGHAHILLSHFHYDHIQGWPFFRPAYVAGNTFDFYSPHECVQQRLQQQQEAPFFPPEAWQDMTATMRYHHLVAEPVSICDGKVQVSTIGLDHPSGAFAFRLEAEGKSFVYASDGAYPFPTGEANDPTQSYIDFFRDADLLVFDAQFSLAESMEKRAWGHSSAVIGVELAARANVKQLALFHHDPNSSDAQLEHLLDVGNHYAANMPVPHQTINVELFLAREGMEVEVYVLSTSK